MESEEQQDRILLQKLKLGDEISFRKIYTKYYRQLYSVALKYLRSRDRAEDAVQDIFIKLWNGRKKLEKSGSLRGFLFTSLKNHVLNIISRRKRRLKRDIELSYKKKIDHQDAGNIIVLSKYQEFYKVAVEQLPEKRREVFKLRTNDGLTNREVAEYLHISLHTVKSHYYKASQFIRVYINEHIKNIQTGS